MGGDPPAAYGGSPPNWSAYRSLKAKNQTLANKKKFGMLKT